MPVPSAKPFASISLKSSSLTGKVLTPNVPEVHRGMVFIYALYVPNALFFYNGNDISPGRGLSWLSRLRGAQRATRGYTGRKFRPRPGSVARGLGVRSRTIWQGITGSRSADPAPCAMQDDFIKKWKTSAVSTTDWMVETQLCKLRGTSDTFVGLILYFIYNMVFVK